MSSTTIRSNVYRPNTEKIVANGHSFLEGDLVQLIDPQTDETFRILHKLRVLGVRAHYRLRNLETDQEVLQFSSNLVAAYQSNEPEHSSSLSIPPAAQSTPSHSHD
jgi:hypothetical protein